MGIVNAVFGIINQLGWQMSGSIEQLSRADEYMKDITHFMELSRNNEFLREPDQYPLEIKSIEFKNVRFKYPTGEKYVLDGISFTLKGGFHYAFVGKNGVGKSTIIKLLAGLYSEYEGEILINEKELRAYSSSTLKAMFSVVYQDFSKFYTSLKDNILLGDISGTDNEDRISKTIQIAGLDNTVAELNNGVSTYLGKIKENGQDISGGQWQRVAIARSLISRAPVKILDEPTAALDPINESNIYYEFEKLMQGKTTVFISHRLGSTKLADEIFVIDDGCIVECGTHEELMDFAGLYADMYESQRGWYD